jgi:hypothetical protein
MQYFTGRGEVKTHNTYNSSQNIEFVSYNENDCYFYHEIEPFKKKLSSFIKQWTLEESQKQDVKLKDLSKIESIIENIALKHGAISIEVINDSDKYFEKFFIVKIPSEMSVSERRNVFNKIVDETIPLCEEKGLLDLFMNTSIFLRR